MGGKREPHATLMDVAGGARASDPVAGQRPRRRDAGPAWVHRQCSEVPPGAPAAGRDHGAGGGDGGPRGATSRDRGPARKGDRGASLLSRRSGAGSGRARERPRAHRGRFSTRTIGVWRHPARGPQAPQSSVDTRFAGARDRGGLRPDDRRRAAARGAPGRRFRRVGPTMRRSGRPRAPRAGVALHARQAAGATPERPRARVTALPAPASGGGTRTSVSGLCRIRHGARASLATSRRFTARARLRRAGGAACTTERRMS